jgi:hypothetical protein
MAIIGIVHVMQAIALVSWLQAFGIACPLVLMYAFANYQLI